MRNAPGPPWEPAAPPLVAQSRDGTPIACWRRGSGPPLPLLLVHGSGEDHGRWRGIDRALAAQFTVVTMDRRGHGASGDGQAHTLEAEADDVAAVLDLLGGRAHVMGHSYGALCCLEAMARGAGIETLVLHEPCLPLAAAPAQPGLAERLQALLDEGDREAVVAAFFQDVVRAPLHRLRLLRSLPIFSTLVNSAHTLARELRATERYRFDAGRFAGLDVPVLLLVGRELESPFLVGAVRQILDALPGSRLRALPAGQHLALDAAPAEVVAAVTEFVHAAAHPAEPRPCGFLTSP